MVTISLVGHSSASDSHVVARWFDHRSSVPHPTATISPLYKTPISNSFQRTTNFLNLSSFLIFFRSKTFFLQYYDFTNYHTSLNSSWNLGILSGGRGQPTISLPFIAPLNIASTTSMKSCFLWNSPIHFV